MSKDIFETFEGLGQSSSEDSHWFLSNAFFWMTDDNVITLLERAKKKMREECGKKPLHTIIVAVPLPSTAVYDISWYMPLVKGCTVIHQGDMKP